jgi:hypothetical protein
VLRRVAHSLHEPEIQILPSRYATDEANSGARQSGSQDLHIPTLLLGATRSFGGLAPCFVRYSAAWHVVFSVEMGGSVANS